MHGEHKPDTHARRLDIEPLGFGLQIRRIHTGMLYLFDILDVKEIKRYLDEHASEIDALYEVWRQQQQQKGG